MFPRVVCRAFQSTKADILLTKRVIKINRNISRCLSDKVSYTKRTHTCGSPTIADVGQTVHLCGWLRYKRLGTFLVLHDWHEHIQLIVPPNKPELATIVKDLHYETVLEVTGKVIPRPTDMINPGMRTGEIEVEVENITLLNPAISNLPIVVRDKLKNVSESVRMEYRYLDIRRKLMQRNLRLRSKVIMKMREFLANMHEFVDVETPTLFRRTPGGAKEFLVPSNHAGRFYSLPQSPQQFKQLLMVGGIDRYFQVARCYRDEGAKPDRQPEFTQLDIEMSFVDKEGIISLVEDMLTHSWPEHLPAITTPFPRLTYDQAMRLYGTDKPDTRFNVQIQRLSSPESGWGIEKLDKILGQSSGALLAVKFDSSYNCKKHISGSKLNKLTKQISEKWENIEKLVSNFSVESDGTLKGSIIKAFNPEVIRSLRSDLDLQPGDFVVLAAGQNTVPYEILGRYRLLLADLLETEGVTVRQKDTYNFLWVDDFPLFLPREDGEEGLESAHHPFTDVHPDDRHLLYTQPDKVRGQHYDLVLNGSEIGGGSIRIHQADQQRRILNDILQVDCSELEHLLKALDCGCPPHGGIALGLDRLFAIMCDAPSIRDVIAFPKSTGGYDLMSKAPACVSQENLDSYHIQVKDIATENKTSSEKPIEQSKGNS